MILTLLTAPPLSGVPHGFFGRTGGVSTEAFASLNVGFSTADDPDAVARNRTIVRETIGAKHLVTVSQVHGRAVVTVDGPHAGPTPQADALVTRTPGVALGILTADCAPILLADAAAGVVGAAHAGWKGALLDIPAATIAAMEALGADRSRIAAAVGPCIALRSYEVDTAFQTRFEADDPSFERFFSSGTRAGHAQFDLEGFVVRRLADAGITRIYACGADTCANPQQFFSHRRMTLAGLAHEGRQISVIMLPALRNP
jgi:hypothetical protein